MSKNFRDLTVYKKSYNLAMYVLELTKKFPREEKYALSDQVGRMLNHMIENPERYQRKGKS